MLNRVEFYPEQAAKKASIPVCMLAGSIGIRGIGDIHPVADGMVTKCLSVVAGRGDGNAHVAAFQSSWGIMIVLHTGLAEHDR